MTLSVLILSVGCADSDRSAPGEGNLFFESGNDAVTPQSANQPFNGLWESAEYEDNGLTKQIRWKLTGSETVLAKKCSGPNGDLAFVQVSLPLVQGLSSNETVTPFAVSPSENDKVTQVKVMDGNKPCRVSMDPSQIASASIIASGTDEFDVQLTGANNQEIQLQLQEEASTSNLTRIGF